MADKESDDSAIDTVVQPDIFVVCDKDKRTKRGVVGAPDFIIEILSESTAGKDLGAKLELYEKHGVEEYWIVDPWSKLVIVHIHDGKRYKKAITYDRDQTLKSGAVSGLEISLQEIFEDQ